MSDIGGDATKALVRVALVFGLILVLAGLGLWGFFEIYAVPVQ